jgi:peroxiredoxin
MPLQQRVLLLVGAALVMAAALALLFQVGIPAPSSDAPVLNAPAPDFAAFTLQGERRQLSALRGQTVIINFWATWCGPCLVEMPILQSIHETHTNVHILAVNLGESEAIMREWAQTAGLTYDLLVDKEQAIAARYQLRGQPSTYVIAPDGIITHIYYGPVNAQALAAALN